jgi:hexosaminidase
VVGERGFLLVNIYKPCTMRLGDDLTVSHTLSAAVGQIPFNFQIGKDAQDIPLPKPATADGELEVRIDGCTGAPAVTASLSPAVAHFGITALPPIELPAKEGKHDLCFIFTRSKLDPIWVIGSLELSGTK